MVLFAFSIEDQVEKYGAYVGIAAFFGLAILSLLYFAQAREVKRLREWAGRAPERAAELEYEIAEHAQEVRRAPVAQPARVVAQPQRTVVPEPVTNGVTQLKPEEVAALAFARAAGVHEPHEPKPHPVPAAAAAAPLATATVAEPALNGGGNGAPPPATPAARRSEQPAPLPPRRKPPAARRPAPSAPPPRESNTRAVVLTAVVGVAVLAAAAALAFGVFGGDDKPSPGTAGQPTATATAEGSDKSKGNDKPKPTPTPGRKSDAKVMVYNATGVPQLAAGYVNELTGAGYTKEQTGADTLAEDQATQTSYVMYGPHFERQARLVAQELGIEQTVALDDAIKTALASTTEAAKQKGWNVVVVLGQDKSTR